MTSAVVWTKKRFTIVKSKSQRDLRGWEEGADKEAFLFILKTLFPSGKNSYLAISVPVLRMYSFSPQNSDVGKALTATVV